VRSPTSPLLLILLSGLDAHAAASGSEGEFWPEVSAYINLNSTTEYFSSRLSETISPGTDGMETKQPRERDSLP